jgi:hypothetical protein
MCRLGYYALFIQQILDFFVNSEELISETSLTFHI